MGVALQAEGHAQAVDEELLYESLSVESRYALIQAFTGEYEGMPALPEEVLRRIFACVVQRVAPFVADLGEGVFRCTACMRDFDSLSAVQQHARTSQRHVRMLQAAAGL